MFGMLEVRMAQVIDYEQLIAGYWERLATILREFRPADDCEFLEAWVPDDDDHRSIAGIVEAAKLARLPCIALDLGPKTVEKLDFDRLKIMLAWFGIIRVGAAEPDGKNIRVEVSF
jgi:hypothetical protein